MHLSMLPSPIIPSSRERPLMRRHLFHLTTALSLLFFLATAILYTRSLFTADCVVWSSKDGFTRYALASGNGMMMVQAVHLDPSISVNPFAGPAYYGHLKPMAFRLWQANVFPDPASPPPMTSPPGTQFEE